MDKLQAEIDTSGWGMDVQFLGVNEAGLEGGNPVISLVSTLPWLQETHDEPVWTDWDVTYRDIIILDDRNVPAAVFNVTTYNLAVQANYDSLRALLGQVAAGTLK